MKTRASAAKRFALWIGVYVVTVVAVSWAFSAGLVPANLAVRIPVALLPMVPAVLSAFASVDRYRLLDEMERRIQAEGILFSFLLTAIATFSYGFLEIYAGFPRLPAFVVWPVLAVGWMIGAALANRRYA